MKTIALLNQKGGVSKTTTTVNLGAGFARAGKKTLVIDLDGQANLTRILTGKIFKEAEEYKPKIKNKKENIEENKIDKIIKSLEKINKELSVINIEEIDMDDYKKLKEVIGKLKITVGNKF